MTNWITIHHPVTGATAEVAEEAIAVYGGRGWERGPLPDGWKPPKDDKPAEAEADKPAPKKSSRS